MPDVLISCGFHTIFDEIIGANGYTSVTFQRMQEMKAAEELERLTRLVGGGTDGGEKVPTPFASLPC